MPLSRARPRTLFRSNIPFIVPSSGSIGDNGALSGVVALPLAYPHAYVYIPADRIVAGSAAGFYYAVFSSTSAATLYNNLYVSGEPTVPGTPTAFATTGPGAYTQTTSAVTALAYTLPAGTVGPNGKLRFEGATRTANNANGKTLALRFTATGISTLVMNSTAGAAFIATLRAMGAGVQIGKLVASTNYNAGQDPQRTTFDMTAAQSFNLAPAIANAAADYIVLLEFEIILEA